MLDFKSPIQGLLGVHLRYGLHTRAVTVYRDTLTRGFSYFVTSIAAPVASGWSNCRVGLTPTGKRRLSTAHTRTCRRRLFRLDARGFDDRPPFLDFGLLQSAECFWRLLFQRKNVLPDGGLGSN